MERKNILLDVDEMAMENNLHIVKNELEEEFNNMFGPLTETEVPSKVVKPETGFCIKGFQVNNNKKIFINICHTDGIPAPMDISENDLTEILQSDEPHSYKVPMSISDPRLVTDKSGKQETACDIAINSVFYKKIEKSGLFQNFFITLIFEALENKYEIEIKEDDWIILKNRTVFGTLVPHRVQNRDVQKVKEYNSDKTQHGASQKIQKPLIEVLPDNYNKPFDIVSSPNNEDPKVPITLKKPEYKLIQETINNEIVKFIAQFQLPDCTSTKEITLNVNDDRIVLECKKRGYYFDGFVNVTINSERCTSHFDIETKALTVDLPTIRRI